MFVHSKTPTQSLPIPLALVNQPPRWRIEQLQKIAQRHEICYELSPEWSISEGRRVRVGFQLELCGADNHAIEDGIRHAVPGCSYCLQTYEDMRQVAEWILPRDERLSHHEIQAFDRALHIAPPRRKHRSEVVLNVFIVDPSEINGPADDSDDHRLTEIERLSELGIHEGYWQNDGVKHGRT
jgi:hypothetical protein